MVKDDISLVCAAGAGTFSRHSSDVGSHRSGGHLDNVGIHDCKSFRSVLGPLQTVQRSELRRDSGS